MTLSLYIARRFALMVLAVFAIFFGILFLVDMVEEIRDFGDVIGLGGAAHLALLNAPGTLYRILPLIVVLATVALFLALARSSELVVIRASGRSALRTLVAPVITALLIGALAVAVMNPIVAATLKQYEQLASRYSGSGQASSFSGEGLWMRQGGPEGQSLIRADRASLDGTELYGATFLTFVQGKGPTVRLEARQAVLSNGSWTLTGVKEWRLDTANPERDAKTHDSLKIPSDLTVDRIRNSFGTPAAIPIWELPAFIAGLQAAGFSAQKHLVWLQMELALPLMLAGMVLIGAGFTMRHTRFGRIGLMVLLAMCAGFGIFFMRNFAQVLGENGQIPVALAAWSPPVAAVLASLGLLLHLEDG